MACTNNEEYAERMRIMSLHEAVWVYKKVTKHSVNGVPTGTSHAVVICDRGGSSLEVPGTQAATEQFLYSLAGNAPRFELEGFSAPLDFDSFRIEHLFSFSRGPDAGGLIIAG